MDLVENFSFEKAANLTNEIAEKVEDKIESVKELEVTDVMDFLGINMESNGNVGPRNVTCITTWCGTKLASCSLDANCRDNMACAKDCGSDNSTCTFLCSETYQSKATDNLMRCMFVDHKCLYLPEPDAANNVKCRDPKSSVVEKIDPSTISGTWYVNYGMNP